METKKVDNQVKLKKTCDACPEEYDAFVGEELVGYLRLRHGYFTAEYKGETVYATETKGDGIFNENERQIHLNNAKTLIWLSHFMISDTI